MPYTVFMGFLSFIHLKGFAWDGRWAAWHDSRPSSITVQSTKRRDDFGADAPSCVTVTSPQAVGNAFALCRDRLFVVSALGGLSLIIHDLNGLLHDLNDVDADRGASSEVVPLADRVHWENVDRTFCTVLESEADKCVVALVMKSGEICVSAVDVKSGVLSQSFRIGE